MANIKISELTAATSLNGAELVEIVQSGVNVKSTIGDVRNFIPTNASTASYITSSIINVPNGIAGLDVNGNLSAGVVLLQDTLSNLSSVVPYSGELVYTTDTQNVYVGNSTSSISSSYPFLKLDSSGSLIIKGNILNTTSSIDNLNSNLIGALAGYGATGATSSSFIGIAAGSGSVNSANSVFIGTTAGNNAKPSNSSVMIGIQAGYGTISSSNCVFVGAGSGYGVISPNNTTQFNTFIGNSSGYQLQGTTNAVVIGQGAGNSAQGGTSASYSIFIGNNAGSRTVKSLRCIYIGDSTGRLDSLDNTLTNGANIAIGDNCRPNGFSNSITIGRSTMNSAVSQSNIGNTFYINGIYSSATTTATPTTTSKAGFCTNNPQHTLEANGTFCHIPASGSNSAILPYTGSMEFSLLNNTTLLVNVRGYDGVIRSGSIALV